MNILYLYSELMGYQIPVLISLVKEYNATVYVLHDKKNKLTTYQPPLLENVIYIDKETLSQKELISLSKSLNPSVVYISGWMYKDYLKVARVLKKKNIPIICGFDDIWYGTLRQQLGRLIFPLLKQMYFTHAWVAGPYQYEFARKLGFNKNEIIFNCLSADTDLFKNAFQLFNNSKSEHYPHNFLFVGRFEKVKGIDILLRAWNNIKDNRRDWNLTLIGSGSLKTQLSHIPDIQVIDFLPPEVLITRLADFGCFVLPSRKEPWALVLHEFAVAGFPLICSEVCGASTLFVIPNYNGYTFKANDLKDLEEKMLKIINTSDDELIRMSISSHLLGERITPNITAASFMSVLANNI